MNLLTDLDEPLATSAPLAVELARENCDADCRNYHGFWQFYRLTGLFPSILQDTPFLVSALANLSGQSGYQRVLITGSADYGTLARVIHAYRDVPQPPDITMVDICETPLRVNEWYAKRHATEIETVCSDILAFEPASQYDLIVSHSFINQFDYDTRRDLVSKWHSLLRPGGKLVTTSRIRYGLTDRELRYTSEEIVNITDKAMTLAQQLGHPALNARDFAREVHHYAEHKVSWPFGSRKKLEEYFLGAGFELESVELGKGDHSNRPSSTSRSERIRLIARRPVD